MARDVVNVAGTCLGAVRVHLFRFALRIRHFPLESLRIRLAVAEQVLLRRAGVAEAVEEAVPDFVAF